MFLPWSPLLNLGQAAFFLPFEIEFIAVSVSVRVAVVAAWTGLVLYEYTKRLRVLPHVLILSSGVLSFSAVAIFAQTGWLFSFGPYLALSGGACKALGVVLERLELEIVIEREGTKTGQ